MGDSHYYDNMTFSRILKRQSTIKRPSDGEDVSYNSSSIIYKYDPTWTPLTSSVSDYRNLYEADSTFFSLKNQILSISGEPITVGYGKNVDVSLNKYIDGKKTYNTTDVDLSGVPFLGNYSTQQIEGVSAEVLDLFEYKIKSYTISTTNLNPNIVYENLYTNQSFSVYSHTIQVPPYTTTQFSYDDSTNEWYISNPLSDPRTICSAPVPTYGYSRIYAYTYPETNVNNIVSDMMVWNSNLGKMIPNMISEKIALPSLP